MATYKSGGRSNRATLEDASNREPMSPLKRFGYSARKVTRCTCYRCIGRPDQYKCHRRNGR